MMELTKERLMALSNRENVGAICGDEIAEMARQLLAGLEKKPVAYMYKDRLHTDARFSLHTRFGNWSQEDINEYEITEIPLYAAPQLPQPAVDQKDVESLATDLMKRIDKITGERHSVATLSSLRVSIVEACRAAMLKGAEPVTTAYKLPANTPCKEAPEHIWLQTAGVWPENGELTWCSDNQHPDDTLYVRADIVAGNSPVIPDDVRRMDWLVSKTVDVREPMVYGSHSIFWSQTITDEEEDYHATKLREQIDAAMEAEQAAAPQQEVK